MNILRPLIIFVLTYAIVYLLLTVLASVSVLLANIVGALLVLGSFVWLVITIRRTRY